MFRIKSRKKKTVLSICSISIALLLVAAFALQLPLMSYRYVRDQILEWRTRNLPALIQEKRAEMSCFYNSSRQHGQDAYIAHGGGIGQYTYTNSVEGFEDSIAKGFKFIEVDLLETVDGHLIGAHDWKTLSEHTGRDEVELRKMPLCELEKLKINDKFQILSGGGDFKAHA